MTATHVMNSALGQRRSDKGCGAKPAVERHPELASDLRVSMLAALLFLEDVYGRSGKFANADRKDEEISRRGKAALIALLTWPRHSETRIAFALSRTSCEMLITGMEVDPDVLKESEERADVAKNARIEPSVPLLL